MLRQTIAMATGAVTYGMKKAARQNARSLIGPFRIRAMLSASTTDTTTLPTAK